MVRLAVRKANKMAIMRKIKVTKIRLVEIFVRTVA